MIKKKKTHPVTLTLSRKRTRPNMKLKLVDVYAVSLEAMATCEGITFPFAFSLKLRPVSILFYHAVV